MRSVRRGGGAPGGVLHHLRPAGLVLERSQRRKHRKNSIRCSLYFNSHAKSPGVAPGCNFVALSGCSGGGKSTLLAELARRGHPTVDEPGRRIVQAELDGDGRALPWTDLAAFARRAIELALADREAASAHAGWIFFDRGLVDAAAALEHATGEPALRAFRERSRYHPTVFMAPPWPEIYAADRERRHGLDAAAAEYERLQRAYSALGYRLAELPKVGVAERADFVLATLGGSDR